MARTLLAAVLVVVVGPVLLPWTTLDAAAFHESDRLLSLAANSLALIGGTVVLAVPLGTFVAIAVERGWVAGANVIRRVVAVGLFIPLSVYAVAWQTLLNDLRPADRSWTVGLLPAVLIHAAAALPWVIWIVSAVVRTTDRSLEDEAALSGRPMLALRPRLATALACAAGWTAVQAGTEIPVTDMMLVRTFAEEVYTQLVAAPDAVPAAVAVTLPAWLLAVGIAGIAASRLVRMNVPAADALPSTRAKRWATGVVWIGLAIVVALPVGGLVRTASAGGFVTQMTWAVELHSRTLLSSLAAAVVAGAIAAGLALGCCRFASGWFARFLVVVIVLAAVTPGPLVGLGLKAEIEILLSLEDRLVGPGFLRAYLYDRPSPLPGIWAAVVRFFPIAVALIWPAMRAIPRELLDAVRQDGAGEWRLVYGPLVGPATVRAAVAVALLAIGEVSAGKLVSPPGRREYILDLFAQMHYGAVANVAAMAILLIFTLSIITTPFRGVAPASPSRPRTRLPIPARVAELP